MELTKADLVFVREWAECVIGEFNDCPNEYLLAKIKNHLGCDHCHIDYCTQNCPHLK